MQISANGLHIYKRALLHVFLLGAHFFNQDILNSWSGQLPIFLCCQLPYLYMVLSFIHLFIYSFIHLFIYSFIHLFIYSFIHLFIYFFTINSSWLQLGQLPVVLFV